MPNPVSLCVSDDFFIARGKEKPRYLCVSGVLKLVEAVGIEPTSHCHNNPEKTALSPAPSAASAHISAQILGADCPHLAQVASKWSKLPFSAREAISQLVNTFVKEDLR